MGWKCKLGHLNISNGWQCSVCVEETSVRLSQLEAQRAAALRNYETERLQREQNNLNAARVIELEALLEKESTAYKDTFLASSRAYKKLQDRIAELKEQLRDQAKGHQADARCWQIERDKLNSRLTELQAQPHRLYDTPQARQESNTGAQKPDVGATQKSSATTITTARVAELEEMVHQMVAPHDHAHVVGRLRETEAALSRFKGIAEAVDPSYSDAVIIRCEVTAGDVRAMVEALDSAQNDDDCPNGESTRPAVSQTSKEIQDEAGTSVVEDRKSETAAAGVGNTSRGREFDSHPASATQTDSYTPERINSELSAKAYREHPLSAPTDQNVKNITLQTPAATQVREKLAALKAPKEPK